MNQIFSFMVSKLVQLFRRLPQPKTIFLVALELLRLFPMPIQIRGRGRMLLLMLVVFCKSYILRMALTPMGILVWWHVGTGQPPVIQVFCLMMGVPPYVVV